MYLVIYGLGFSLFNAVYWAALGYVVDSAILGTANGTMFSLRSIGLVVVPIMNGYIVENTDKYHGYFWVSFLLAILAGSGCVTGIFVYLHDMRFGAVLNAINPITAKELYFVNKDKGIVSKYIQSIN